MSGMSWRERVAEQKAQSLPFIEIPADATLTQLDTMLGQFGSNAANAEYEMRIAEANYLALKQRSDEWMLLETARIDAKSETAKRAAALARLPDLRSAIEDANRAEGELLLAKGIRDRWKMAFEAVSRIVTVRQLQHDVETRTR